MRHGQSAWNKKNVFTGWVDIPLSEQGIEESRAAGQKIAHIPIDVAFTSTLVRCHMSLILSLLHHSSQKLPIFKHENNPLIASKEKLYAPLPEIPVYQALELNERYYGHLQGLNKKETAEQYGEAQVKLWRRSFDTNPPHGESLQETAQRTLPYFQKTIVPHLAKGESVFICAHGNSLRSIVMHLDGLSPDEVVQLEIGTGEILLYEWANGLWKKESI